MKKALILMTVVLVVAMSATAFAAIDLSRHDMGAMGGAYAAVAGIYGDCSACHLPHKAQGAKLWPVTPPGYDVSFSLMGTLCARCHDGVTISAAVSANLSYGPYSAPGVGLTGHRLNVTLTPDQPKGGAGSGQTDVEGSGLPYTAAADRTGAGDYMECTSCHDVHNANTNRPFVTLPGATALDNLCTTCHTTRTQVLYGAANALGTHPVDITGTVNGDMGVNGNNPIVAGMDEEARTVGTGLATDGPWNSGGHLIAGGLHCATCHMVHGDEPNTYAEDASVRSGIFDASLLIYDQLDNSTGAFRNAVCEACHQGDNTNQAGNIGEFPNPGDTPTGIGGANADPARTWHPVDSGAENGAGAIVGIAGPAGWPFGGGGEVVCSSCHAAHGGLNAGSDTRVNTPMLRDDVAAPGDSFCMACHTAALTAALDCFHAGHINGDGSGGTLAAMAPAGLGTAWGNPPANGMDCNVCHQAHNAPFPRVLRVEYSDTSGGNPDAICTLCHTVNPSTYTVAAPSGAGQSDSSHFVGDVTLAAGGDYEANGYGIAAASIDAFPIPEAVTTWPVNQDSVYGGTISGGGRGDMTCLSCHSMSYCGEGAANTMGQTGDTDSSWMVITSSGNPVNQPAGFSQAYLCSGCHGADPLTMLTGGETGFTHPTAAATPGLEDPKAGWNMTKSANGAVNCESCHRPHDADTDAGTYILESDGTGTGVYNGSATGQTIMPLHAHDTFCNGCHTK